jgi:hypothetical protein
MSSIAMANLLNALDFVGERKAVSTERSARTATDPGSRKNRATQKSDEGNTLIPSSLT